MFIMAKLFARALVCAQCFSEEQGLVLHRTTFSSIDMAEAGAGSEMSVVTHICIFITYITALSSLLLWVMGSRAEPSPFNSMEALSTIIIIIIVPFFYFIFALCKYAFYSL